MNGDKAYVFGLIVGGGVWTEPEAPFQIRLPFGVWGRIDENPDRSAQISRDIMRFVNPLLHNIYEINVSYSAGQKYWIIYCEGNTAGLIHDMRQYGIEPKGDIKEHVDLSRLVQSLTDKNLKKRFIAGLADSIGSTVLSHRRFNEDYPTVSFEFKGFNYNLVCTTCKLLRQLGCPPDQILWNHPNLHAGKDPYYRNWRKGTKLRVMLEDFDSYGAFAFNSRATSARTNLDHRSRTHNHHTLMSRNINISYSCFHPDESDRRIPESIRGGHYLHWRHICAALQCPYVPQEIISEICTNAGTHLTPFPIITKGDIQYIEQIIHNTPIMYSRNYMINSQQVNILFNQYKQDKSTLLYARGFAGYPVSRVLEGVAYIIAHPDELTGKRIKGNLEKFIEKHVHNKPDLHIEILVPDIMTPLVLRNEERGVLIGAINPRVYETLIIRDATNPFKFSLRAITEEDLNNG